MVFRRALLAAVYAVAAECLKKRPWAHGGGRAARVEPKTLDAVVSIAAVNDDVPLLLFCEVSQIPSVSVMREIVARSLVRGACFA